MTSILSLNRRYPGILRRGRGRTKRSLGTVGGHSAGTGRAGARALRLGRTLLPPRTRGGWCDGSREAGGLCSEVGRRQPAWAAACGQASGLYRMQQAQRQRFGTATREPLWDWGKCPAGVAPPRTSSSAWDGGVTRAAVWAWLRRRGPWFSRPGCGGRGAFESSSGAGVGLLRPSRAPSHGGAHLG